MLHRHSFSNFEKDLRITSKQFKEAFVKPSANALTKQIMSFASANGFKVWRQNNHATFDIVRAAKYVLSLIFSPSKIKSVKSQKAQLSIIIGGLRKCYNRKTVGLKGVSDIIGFGKRSGQPIAIEVKVGKDKLSVEQIRYLEDVKVAGGIAIVAKDFDGFVEKFKKEKAA